jgi:hypothetical protein
MTKNTRFDLEERTAKFGENIILLCKSIYKDEITRPLISQIISKRAKSNIQLNIS